MGGVFGRTGDHKAKRRGKQFQSPFKQRFQQACTKYLADNSLTWDLRWGKIAKDLGWANTIDNRKKLHARYQRVCTYFEIYRPYLLLIVQILVHLLITLPIFQQSLLV